MLANQLGFVAERGSVRDLELGKTVERVRGLAAPATILKESAQVPRPLGDGLRWW
jgi:hypothetical protein